MPKGFSPAKNPQEKREWNGNQSFRLRNPEGNKGFLWWCRWNRLYFYSFGIVSESQRNMVRGGKKIKTVSTVVCSILIFWDWSQKKLHIPIFGPENVVTIVMHISPTPKKDAKKSSLQESMWYNISYSQFWTMPVLELIYYQFSKSYNQKEP